MPGFQGGGWILRSCAAVIKFTVSWKMTVSAANPSRFICRHGTNPGQVSQAACLEFRVQGLGFRVQGSGFRVQGSGFRVQGSGCRVQGAGV